MVIFRMSKCTFGHREKRKKIFIPVQIFFFQKSTFTLFYFQAKRNQIESEVTNIIL